MVNYCRRNWSLGVTAAYTAAAVAADVAAAAADDDDDDDDDVVSKCGWMEKSRLTYAIPTAYRTVDFYRLTLSGDFCVSFLMRQENQLV